MTLTAEDFQPGDRVEWINPIGSKRESYAPSYGDAGTVKEVIREGGSVRVSFDGDPNDEGSWFCHPKFLTKTTKRHE